MTVWRETDTFMLCEKRWQTEDWQIAKFPKTDKLPEGKKYLLIGPIGQSWTLEATNDNGAFIESEAIIERQPFWAEDLLEQITSLAKGMNNGNQKDR